MTLAMADLTGFQRDVLAATRHAHLDGGAPNGQTIKAVLEEHGYETLQSGRFYPTLDDLVNFGLLEKRQNPEDKSANHYEITTGTTISSKRDASFSIRSNTTLPTTTDERHCWQACRDDHRPTQCGIGRTSRPCHAITRPARTINPETTANRRTTTTTPRSVAPRNAPTRSATGPSPGYTIWAGLPRTSPNE